MERMRFLPLKNDKTSMWLIMGGIVLLGVVLFILWALAAYAPIYPEASGVTVYSGKSVTIDASNSDQGYFMVKHSGSKKRLKIQVTLPSGSKKNYDLNGEGEFEVYGFTEGDGTYKIHVLQNASTKKSSKSYASLYSQDIKVTLSDENNPFLTPSQYAWYTPESNTVAKSEELCAGLTSDRDKADTIFTFLTTNMSYDKKKAKSSKGKTIEEFIPVVDETLVSLKGICFDYAAMMACMLRSQGIPTKVVIGNFTAPGNAQYHAWNNVYIDGKWELMDATLGGEYAEKYYTPAQYE